MIDCIIPARSGSKGIPKKNIVLLNGVPLIAYSIYIAKKSEKINNIYVSTDSYEIAEISKFYGAKTPFLRPSHLATDKSKDRDLFLNFFEEASKLGLPLSKDVVHLRPTTPGRNQKIIDAAICEFLSDKSCTSMRSAHKSDIVPQKWFIEKEGYFCPLVQSISNFEITNMPRQSFPPVYIPNGYIDIVRYETFIKKGVFHGNKTKSYITDQSIDIDNKVDLENSKLDTTISQIAKSIKKEFKF